MKTPRKRRSLWPLLLALAAAALAGALPAGAAPPTLTPVAEQDLQRVYRAGSRYTFRMRYADPDNDRPRTAQLIDEAPSGTLTINAARVEGTDYRNGVIVVWDVNGFEQGRHKLSFVAKSADGEARWPPLQGQPFEIVAESLVTKWVIMGSGMVVGLLFVPFLVYVLARSLNRRGDPSGAARVGLLLGILACCALFIYLFASFYGLLAYAIGGIAALALLVVVLTRR